MTAYAEPTHGTPTSWPMFAALGAGVALVLAAVGTFAASGEESTDQGLQEFLVVAGIIVVASAAVFGLVVRTAGQGNPGRRAVILAALAVPTILVFWSGLPSVLAVGAIACALASRGDSLPWSAKVAVGLSAVVLAAAVALAFLG